MPETLESILARVAAGELSPEEAEPLVAAAASERTGHASPATTAPAPPPPAPASESRRTVRLEVMEDGRRVVNLRVPMSFASLAGMVPGLSGAHAERLREAIRSGEVGTILEVLDEDGDGVVISTE